MTNRITTNYTQCAARTLGLITLLLLTASWSWSDERRAARPKWRPEERERVFFKDAFRDALQGQRPDHLSPEGSEPSADPMSVGEPSTETEHVAAGWAKIIDAETIEDEVKKMSQSLDGSLTTPAKFASRGHQDVRRQFTILTVLFGVIHEYDSTDIRWRNEAQGARNLFSHVAGVAKVGSPQAFDAAKQGKESLRSLLRGENLSAKQNEASGGWGTLVDRAIVMEQMEQEFRDRLAPAVADEAEFKKNSELLARHAKVLAMLSHAISRPSMPDADAAEYVGYCETIERASAVIIDSLRQGEYAAARDAAAEITKSCDACHENFRG